MRLRLALWLACSLGMLVNPSPFSGIIAQASVEPQQKDVSPSTEGADHAEGEPADSEVQKDSPTSGENGGEEQSGAEQSTQAAASEDSPPSSEDSANAQPSPGQTLLDAASDLKFTANDLGDLQQVIDLAKRAREAGLDETGENFAKDLLFACYYQSGETRFQQIVQGIRSQSIDEKKLITLRDKAIADLDNARQISDGSAEIYQLLGRLQAMPGGDRKAALESFNKAVELAESDEKKSQALTMRAGLREKPEESLEDLNEAIRLFSDNQDAYRTRSLLNVRLKKTEEAIADLKKAVELSEGNQPDQAGSLLLLGGLLLEASSEGEESVRQKQLEEAIATFTRLVEMMPDDAAPYMQRAKAYVEAKRYVEALTDVNQALEIAPNNPQLLFLRVEISFRSQNFGKAIEDLTKLCELAPDNAELKMELARAYLANKQPRKAIRMLEELEKELSGNWMMYRLRGDAHLQVAQHAKAISDYRRSLELQPDESETLNNLAWVMATSPDDGVRDAGEAVRLAIQACETTDYLEAHILSTLAAAFADKGDFQTAIKWSTKAVELEKEEETLSQLKQELESYQQRKPWRESMNNGEKEEDANLPSPGPDDV